MELKGEITPSKIFSLLVLAGGLTVAVELKSVEVALAAIFFFNCFVFRKEKTRSTNDEVCR